MSVLADRLAAIVFCLVTELTERKVPVGYSRRGESLVMLEFQVVVASACENCEEARRLADAVKTRFPGVAIDLIDLDREPERQPDSVFAVPTYLLGGRVISLGNPSEEALYDLLEAELQAVAADTEADTR